MRSPNRERYGYRAFLERVAEGVDPYRVCAMRFMIRERHGYRPYRASLREGGGFAEGKDGGSTRP